MKRTVTALAAVALTAIFFLGSSNGMTPYSLEDLDRLQATKTSLATQLKNESTLADIKTMQPILGGIKTMEPILADIKTMQPILGGIKTMEPILSSGFTF